MLLGSNNAAAVWGRFVTPPAAHNLRHGEGIRERYHSDFRASHVPGCLVSSHMHSSQNTDERLKVGLASGTCCPLTMLAQIIYKGIALSLYKSLMLVSAATCFSLPVSIPAQVLVLIA